MSDSLEKETASPVPPPLQTDLDLATDAYDDKLKKTSRSASLTSKCSVPQTGSPPVAGGTIEVQPTLVDTVNPSAPGNAQVDEKHTHTIEQHASSQKEAAQVRRDGEILDTNAENTFNAEDEDIVYPGRLELGLLTFGLCMATFTVALDNTIIATAIPKITTVFDSLDDVGWYGSSYLLTTTALQPSFGRIYTYFNIKYSYLAALCLFEVGSIICAAARNSPMLIVGRAIAGAGASALFSGGDIPYWFL